MTLVVKEQEQFLDALGFGRIRAGSLASQVYTRLVEERGQTFASLTAQKQVPTARNWLAAKFRNDRQEPALL